MNDASKITASDFITAFKHVLQTRAETDPDKLLAAYETDPSWTDYMLGDGGVLDHTASQLRQLDESLRYDREWYTIDAVLYGSENLCGKGKYPAGVHAVIEHENGDDVRPEMWKLLHWRCPLKILIFYDWNDDEKSTGKRRNFAQNTLALLEEMHSTVARFQAEEEAAYLLITAKRKNLDALPEWRYTLDFGQTFASMN